MTTVISTAANVGFPEITVPDGMPHDELLNAMHDYASECDAFMGERFPADTILVRAWPNGRFRASEVVEYRHPRRRYSPEMVRALIAEDAGDSNPLASLHG